MYGNGLKIPSPEYGLQDVTRPNNVYENLIEEIHQNLSCISEKLSPIMFPQPENSSKEQPPMTRQQEQLLGILMRVRYINDSISL